MTNHLTREDVFTAADALVARAEEPTQNKIRVACGDRGSMSTITKHLAAWRAQVEADNRLLATELSEALQERALCWIASMHKEVRIGYAAEHAKLVSEHRRQEVALKADLDAACEEADKLIELLENSRAQTREALADLAVCKSDAEALRSANAQLEAKAIVDAAVIAELRVLSTEVAHVTRKQRGDFSQLSRLEANLLDGDIKPDPNAHLLVIAQMYIQNIDTLGIRTSAGLDFFDVAVWEIRRALEAAYAAANSVQSAETSSGLIKKNEGANPE